MSDDAIRPVLSRPISAIDIDEMEPQYVTRVQWYLEQELHCRVTYLREQGCYHISFPEGTIEETYPGQSTQWTHRTTIRLPDGTTLPKVVRAPLNATQHHQTMLAFPSRVLDGPEPPHTPTPGQQKRKRKSHDKQRQGTRSPCLHHQPRRTPERGRSRVCVTLASHPASGFFPESIQASHLPLCAEQTTGRRTLTRANDDPPGCTGTTGSQRPRPAMDYDASLVLGSRAECAPPVPRARRTACLPARRHASVQPLLFAKDGRATYSVQSA